MEQLNKSAIGLSMKGIVIIAAADENPCQSIGT